MYKYSDVRSVHLEITSHCNARCPMCARTEDGGKTNRQLPLTELSLEDIRSIFPPAFVSQLWEVFMCGNYGDPLVAKNTLEAFEYFKAVHPNLRTKMHTNGSARSPEWWKKLAAVCDEVYFGIDGLGDTNPLYRIGTHFDKIMANAEAFIKAGGKAKWQFIVFRHNEHQIEEARDLAKKMGFHEFNLKKTGRFFSNTRLEVKQEKPVFNSDFEETHRLQMPENPKYLNASLTKEPELLRRYGSMTEYLNSTLVQCQSVATRSLYVSAEGLVFPCCWLAGQMYIWHQAPHAGEIWKHLDKLPEKEQSLSALRHSIKDILEGDFFQKYIPESWNRSSIKEGKSWVCSKTCGKEFNQFKHQFEPRRTETGTSPA
jgi:MoaA/NifB/PqqE/SkfB family radical SAM enzyme